MINKDQLRHDMSAVRAQSPLVHNITNYVTMNNSANALLAIGASPVMAHGLYEVADMVQIAGSLVLNIGTLDEEWVESMIKAGVAMRKLGRPVILDPVGAGATPYRTEVSWKIINMCQPSIIRGNGSEIMALVNANIKSKGVDSSASSDDALESAQMLANCTGAIVVISGETDYVTDGDRVETITSGSTMMARVTAMGCTASAVVGAFAAVNSDLFQASLHAMALMGVAGERAAAYSKGSGSLQVNFIDELYNMTPELLVEEVKQ